MRAVALPLILLALAGAVTGLAIWALQPAPPVVLAPPPEVAAAVEPTRPIEPMRHLTDDPPVVWVRPAPPPPPAQAKPVPKGPDYAAMKKAWLKLHEKETASIDLYDWIEDVKPGYFGIPSTDRPSRRPATWYVVEIRDKSHALIRTPFARGSIVYFAEVNTDGMVDGQALEANTFMHCIGTHAYIDTTGARRTVLSVRVVD